MRTLRDVERDLVEARAVIGNADQIGPTFDNDGHLVTTAAERVASYRQRHARLWEEHKHLLAVLGIRQATHPLSGIPLEWPIPAPLRKHAIWDADKPCRQHCVAYPGQRSLHWQPAVPYLRLLLGRRRQLLRREGAGMTKILGADLKPGDIFKHDTSSNGGRIYEVVDIEEADWIGARYGDFRQSNGEIVCFNVFDDSEYELRDLMPGKRHRMVKVRADDLKAILRSRPSTEVFERLQAALR